MDQAIEILGTVIWPALIFWVIWYLRDEVKRAAPRLTELGLSGAKFAPAPEQKPSLPTGTVAVTAASLEVGKPEIGTPTLVASGLKQLVSDVTARFSRDQIDPVMENMRNEVTARNILDQADQLEAFRYISAALSVGLSHQNNYTAIFGSQLQLLGQMNIDAGVQPAAARAIFDATKSANPIAYQDIAFEQWIGFLLGAGLIMIAATGNYVLTAFGRGFMKYILDRHLPLNKPL